MSESRIQACISLGGNIGDVAETFRSALRRLNQHPQIELRAWSGLYESDSMGRDAGPVFSNAAAVLQTTLEPLPLLDVLQSIEGEHNRTREVRWGPRTLDLDLILFSEQTVTEPRLVVPHPDCWYRRFVLVPLVEVAPEVRHPVIGETLEQLAARLVENEFVIELSGYDLAANEEWLGNTANKYQVRFRDVDAASTAPALVMDFSARDSVHLPPFHIAGAGPDPNQRILDILSAARGTVRRLSDISLSGR